MTSHVTVTQVTDCDKRYDIDDIEKVIEGSRIDDIIQHSNNMFVMTQRS